MIIKLGKNIQLKSLNPGGGSSKIEPLTSLDFVENILNQLKKIEPFQDNRNLFLIHKKKSENDLIPPKSRRMISEMKFLFGSTKFLNYTTIYDEDEKELKFIYYVTFIEIQTAIFRLNNLIELIKHIMESYNLKISDIFLEKNKNLIRDEITKSKKANNLSI